MARILLIDDDDPFRTMLRQTLSHFGHTVIEASNGEEGLKLLPEANADLVITDLVMPEKEGIEVIMELRRLHPQLNIIAMSGGGRIGPANYLRYAAYLGAAKVLTKPFSNAELMTAIDGLLPGATEAGPAAG